MYTSDLHGRSQPSVDFASPGLPRRLLGGWAGLASLIERNRTGPALLLDCGDFGYGSFEGDSTEGRASIRFMNEVGYDAAAVGARDFTGGVQNLEILARLAAFPVLADPMLDVVLGRHASLFRPYVVKEVADTRIGLVGVTDPEIPVLNRRDDVRGLAVPPVGNQLRQYLPAVRAESIDMIVVFGHITGETGLAMADSFPDVDIVLCQSARGPHQGPLPGSAGTPVICADAYGQRLGVVDILYELRDKRVMRCESRLLNVVPGDGEPRAGFAWPGDLRDPSADAPQCFATAEYPPDSTGIRGIATVAAEAAREVADADMSIMPLSIVESGLPAGRVSRRTLYEAVPFMQRLRVVGMDDTTLARASTPQRTGLSEPAPALAGADYFVVGDTTSWPAVDRVARIRPRGARSGPYKVVTTEQWLERIRVSESGRLIATNLSDVWLDYCRDTLRPVAPTRLYPAGPGLARSPVSTLVNVNTATAELLCSLPGIGPKTAERIIEYRATHGRFTTVTELANVKGIGPKRLELVRSLVTVR